MVERDLIRPAVDELSGDLVDQSILNIRPKCENSIELILKSVAYVDLT